MLTINILFDLIWQIETESFETFLTVKENIYISFKFLKSTQTIFEAYNKMWRTKTNYLLEVFRSK